MKYTFEDLKEIMKKLRGEGGCPWDREQTHTSIRDCLIEEAYETAEAIDSGKDEKMYDELGGENFAPQLVKYKLDKDNKIKKPRLLACILIII